MKLPAAVAAPLLLIASALPSDAQPQFRPSGSPPADNLTVETVASGLANPWAIAFLPDGRMLVTERAGRLRIVAQGRHSLAADCRRAASCSRAARAACMTSSLDRDFAKNGTIYFCFAMPVSGGAPDRARPRAAQSTAIRRGSTASR